MAKYLTNVSFYRDGEYHEASFRNPLEFSLPDDAEPSRAWQPLDEAAVAALKKLGVKDAKVVSAPKQAVTEDSGQMAMSQVQGRGKRASDLSPV